MLERPCDGAKGGETESETILITHCQMLRSVFADHLCAIREALGIFYYLLKAPPKTKTHNPYIALIRKNLSDSLRGFLEANSRIRNRKV